jgi:hypothetical protein
MESNQVTLVGVYLFANGLGRVIPPFSFTILALATVMAAPNTAKAEGVVTFWLPGLFGSLAAAPVQPGWSLAAFEYYDSVRAGGDVALAREVTIGRFNPTLRVDVNASLSSRIDIGALIPSYTFEQRFLGGLASVSMTTLVGNVDTTLQGMITGTLGPFGFSRQQLHDIHHRPSSGRAI